MRKFLDTKRVGWSVNEQIESNHNKTWYLVWTVVQWVQMEGGSFVLVTNGVIEKTDDESRGGTRGWGRGGCGRSKVN